MAGDHQNGPVTFQELTLNDGLKMGHAELDVPATLNSLSLDMIELLDPKLREWAGRDDVALVVITGAGDKAFCAGGDIQALYHAIRANHAADKVVDDYPFRFFAEEYRLDYLIHTFPKPILALGHGIVMGGGLGIFGAAKYRVLTETSRLAVPEITIGLFPDAGATWTLRNMSAHHALFLGLTGSHVNAQDALTVGMGTHVLPQAQRGDLIPLLGDLTWRGSVAADSVMLEQYLSEAALFDQSLSLPDGELGAVPETLARAESLNEAVAMVYALEGESKWVDRGIANLRGGCPTTAGIVFEQLRRASTLTLAESFQLELNIATHCARHTDFVEGVRALLIEKDGQPDWRFGEIECLDWDHVLSHFEPPWPTHPLADLAEGDNA